MSHCHPMKLPLHLGHCQEPIYYSNVSTAKHLVLFTLYHGSGILLSPPHSPLRRHLFRRTRPSPCRDKARCFYLSASCRSSRERAVLNLCIHFILSRKGKENRRRTLFSVADLRSVSVSAEMDIHQPRLGESTLESLREAACSPPCWVCACVSMRVRNCKGFAS